MSQKPCTLAYLHRKIIVPTNQPRFTYIFGACVEAKGVGYECLCWHANHIYLRKSVFTDGNHGTGYSYSTCNPHPTEESPQLV